MKRSRSGQFKRELSLPHARAPDFSVFVADRLFHRVDADGTLILTVVQDDRVIKSERLERVGEDEGTASYRSVSVEEVTQQTDICSVRVPLQVFLDAAAAIAATRGVSLQ